MKHHSIVPWIHMKADIGSILSNCHVLVVSRHYTGNIRLFFHETPQQSSLDHHMYVNIGFIVFGRLFQDGCQNNYIYEQQAQ